MAALFQALLLGIGLQHKSVEQLEKEIDLPCSQLMGLFNRLSRKFVQVSSRRLCYITRYQRKHNNFSTLLFRL